MVDEWCDQALATLLSDEAIETYLAGDGSFFVTWPGTERNLDEFQAAYCFRVTAKATTSPAASN